ncbi:MAG: CPBP family intramembrane metalloprotease [Burkholderiales bacterium]|nr:CPBP family intramembrane metalloprotease [Burkholderiales bacterium]
MITPHGPLKMPARSWGLWAFPLFYLGWAFLFWIPILGSEASVWSLPNVFFFLAGGASPLLAGITLAALAGGKQRLCELGWRLIDVRRISLRWLAIILLFWPAFDLFMAGAAVVLGITDRPLGIVWDVLTTPRTLAFMLLLSFVFPAVEEVGLRGYWFDELQERFGPTIASLINGGTWAIWHAPFVWFPGYYASTTFHPELWWWLPSIVLQTLLIVWVYRGTDRSILAALLFHGMMNFTGEFLGLAPEMFPFMLAGNALAAAVLILSWRRSRCGA